jgi:hypothetical protein
MGVQIWVGHLIGPHMSRLGGEARIYGRVTHSDLAIFGDKLFYKKLLSSVQRFILWQKLHGGHARRSGGFRKVIAIIGFCGHFEPNVIFGKYLIPKSIRLVNSPSI